MKRFFYILLALGALSAFAEKSRKDYADQAQEPQGPISWGKNCPDGSVCLPQGQDLEVIIQKIKFKQRLFPGVHGKDAKQFFTEYFSAVLEDARVTKDFDSALIVASLSARAKTPVETMIAYGEMLKSPKRQMPSAGFVLSSEEFAMLHEDTFSSGIEVLRAIADILPDATSAESLALAQGDAVLLTSALLKVPDAKERYSQIKKTILSDEKPVTSLAEMNALIIETQTSFGIASPAQISIDNAILQKRIDTSVRNLVKGQSDKETHDGVYAWFARNRQATADEWLKEIAPKTLPDKVKYLQGRVNPETGGIVVLPVDLAEIVGKQAANPEAALVALTLFSLIASDTTLMDVPAKDLKAHQEKFVEKIKTSANPIADVLELWKLSYYSRNPINGMGLTPKDALAWINEFQKTPKELTPVAANPPLVAEVTGIAPVAKMVDSPKPKEDVEEERPEVIGKEMPPPPKDERSQIQKHPYLTAGSAVVAVGSAGALIHHFMDSRGIRSCRSQARELSRVDNENWSRFAWSADKEDASGRAKALLDEYEKIDFQDTAKMTEAWMKIADYFSSLAAQGVEIKWEKRPMTLRNASIRFIPSNGVHNPRLIIPELVGSHSLWAHQVNRRENNGVTTDELRKIQLQTAFIALKGLQNNH